ncbi:hypothetical protein A4R35_00815 [Thermogemmatispora tikiterensis]|uniref:Uncharacterized protein n=1 Tax=Thermogemmatispora tikiterensis TaxID=1825093 RepID=A0A328VET9_9CHLR|nr:hypothetical protein A4R35_00815 [Thermogemmatispora tikiterensis]
MQRQPGQQRLARAPVGPPRRQVPAQQFLQAIAEYEQSPRQSQRGRQRTRQSQRRAKQDWQVNHQDQGSGLFGIQTSTR